MKGSRLKSWVLKLFMLVCLGFIIYSGYHILIWKTKVDENAKIKDKINKHIIKTDDDYVIDFDELRKINSGVVGYIEVPGTNIKYIVVQADDNSYYLTHNFNKKYSQIGWIFVDYRNKLDDSDKNIIIYGHNTADGSMFGSLRNVLKEEWQSNKNNHIVIFVTEKETKKYEVFSTYAINNEEYYITTGFKTDNDYVSFLDKIRNRSNYNYNTSVGLDDKILTLSTCTHNGKKRVVLHAKEVR